MNSYCIRFFICIMMLFVSISYCTWSNLLEEWLINPWKTLTDPNVTQQEEKFDETTFEVGDIIQGKEEDFVVIEKKSEKPEKFEEEAFLTKGNPQEIKKIIDIAYFKQLQNEEKAIEQAQEHKIISLIDWIELCKKLPKYPHLKLKTKNDLVDLKKKLKFSLPFTEFERVVDEFFISARQSSLIGKENWFDGNAPELNFFMPTKRQPDQTFVQKLAIASKSKVAIRGDLHGDIHSLIAFLEWLIEKNYIDNKTFKIKDPMFYLLFLGDYVDRGLYGVEVLYTIMRLKIANPAQVILVRGNHEDLTLNKHYGFIDEVKSKFNLSDKIEKTSKTSGFNLFNFFSSTLISSADQMQIKLSNFYNLLPSALYLGSGKEKFTYLLCCHGGLEMGFNPEPLLRTERFLMYQWIGKLDRFSQFSKLYRLASKDSELLLNSVSDLVKNNSAVSRLNQIGFLWSDFYFDHGEGILTFDRNRGLKYGRLITEYLLRYVSSSKYTLWAVIRAHQHAKDTMKLINDAGGIYQVWSKDQWIGKGGLQLPIPEGSVWTLNVAPCSPYGKEYNFNEDTFIILHIEDEIKNWRIEPHKIKIFSW